jgi:hypothetical protein
LTKFTDLAAREAGGDSLLIGTFLYRELDEAGGEEKAENNE